MSFWIATAILSEPKIEDRVRLWEKFIDVARHLQKLNNFQGLMTFIAGWNNSCIYRLKKTKKKKLLASAREAMASMEELMSTQLSFKKYRTTLREVTPPILPYLGVHLSDLVFIEDGNANHIDGKINIRKRELVHNVISEILHYKQYPPPFTQIPEIAFSMKTFPALPEQALYKLSMQIEPRI